VATEGQWGEIDNPEDVRLYQDMVAAGELTSREAGHATRVLTTAHPSDGAANALPNHRKRHETR
jgi:hypothetical protein